MWITFKKAKKYEKKRNLLDLGYFFVIIEMMFSKVEEVDRYEDDISAKKETEI